MPVTKADGADWGGGRGGGGLGGGNDDTAMSPGRAQAQFGTAALAGYSPNQAAQMIANMGGGGEGAVAQSVLGTAGAAALATQANIQAQQAYELAALQQLQRDLRDIERRRASTNLPPALAFVQDLNLKNLATQISGTGLTTAKLTPTQLASMQQRVIRDAEGRVIGYRDAQGILTGRDPARDERERRMQEGEGGMQTVAPSPDTGQCPAGYIFDEDLQACRLDTGPAERVDYTAPQTYGMMGLLDRVPEGLLGFAETYNLGGESGQGFGPVDFAAANRAFRRSSGTITPYQGYSLL